MSQRAYYDRSEESKRVKEPIVPKAGHKREVQRAKAETEQSAVIGGALAVSHAAHGLNSSCLGLAGLVLGNGASAV